MGVRAGVDAHPGAPGLDVLLERRLLFLGLEDLPRRVLEDDAVVLPESLHAGGELGLDVVGIGSLVARVRVDDIHRHLRAQQAPDLVGDLLEGLVAVLDGAVPEPLGDRGDQNVEGGVLGRPGELHRLRRRGGCHRVRRRRTLRIRGRGPHVVRVRRRRTVRGGRGILAVAAVAGTPREPDHPERSESHEEPPPVRRLARSVVVRVVVTLGSHTCGTGTHNKNLAGSPSPRTDRGARTGTARGAPDGAACGAPTGRYPGAPKAF